MFLRLSVATVAALILSTASPVTASSNAGAAPNGHWITAFTAMPQLTEYTNLPTGAYNATPKFFNTTIRQSLKLDFPADGELRRNIRLRFSNAFGTTPLVIDKVAIARPPNNTAGLSDIDDTTSIAVTFNRGNDAGVDIPNGALAVSDPLLFDFTNITTYSSYNETIQAGSIITITIYLSQGQTGDENTSHPGSRINSYLGHGDQVNAANITGSDVQALAHWYFISAVETWSESTASTFVLNGDSITDGRGSDTDLNDRWPDLLFTQMQMDSATNQIVIANQAAGGNRILADGNGPNVLSRIDRDVLAQSGVKYALIFEGVNDIGVANATEAAQTAIYNQLIAAYRQVITRVHAQGIPIFAATITPFGSLNSTLQPYSDPAGLREQTRSKINTWIRQSGEFDAVVDFDAVVRNPNNVTMLAPQFDSGDDLHPTVAGYQAIADAFPLELFAQWSGGYTGM